MQPPLPLLIPAVLLVLLTVGARWLLLRRGRGRTRPALPAQGAPRTERVVGSFGNYAEAGLAASRLRSAGIRSVLVPTSDVYPYGPAMWHELRVLAPDFERAQSVLAAGPSSRRKRRTDAR